MGSACAGSKDKSDDEVRADLSSSLQVDGLDEDAADCLADLVIEEVGYDAIRDVDIGDREPPPELQDQIAAAAIRGADDCELEG